MEHRTEDGVQERGHGKIEEHTEGRGRSQGGKEEGRRGATRIEGIARGKSKDWARKEKGGL